MGGAYLALLRLHHLLLLVLLLHLLLGLLGLLLLALLAGLGLLLGRLGLHGHGLSRGVGHGHRPHAAVVHAGWGPALDELRLHHGVVGVGGALARVAHAELRGDHRLRGQAAGKGGGLEGGRVRHASRLHKDKRDGHVRIRRCVFKCGEEWRWGLT